jgi:hypothetical protein
MSDEHSGAGARPTDAAGDVYDRGAVGRQTNGLAVLVES